MSHHPETVLMGHLFANKEQKIRNKEGNTFRANEGAGRQTRIPV
jgi:hypothetical protein